MPTVAERALRKSMREKVFDPVYYFVGEDDFLKEGTIREFLAAAVDVATRDFNAEVLRGADVSAAALETALNTLPLLVSSRVVVVRDVHALRKEARAVLARYLKHPASGTVLVLVAPAGEKPERAIAEAGSTVEFPRLSPDRVARWLAHHASSTLGVSISPAAAGALQAAVGDDLAMLAAELDKLASFCGGAEIDAAAVASVVGVPQGQSLGDLLDAVAARDAAHAAVLVAPVLAQPKTTAVMIVMALATQTLAIAWGRAARDRGVAPGALEREFYGLLREGKVYPGRPWGDAVRSWSRASQQWGARESREAIRLLLMADAAAKESRLSSDAQFLETLVLSLCAIGQRVAA